MTEEIIIDGVNVAGCKNYVYIKEERYKPECNCRLTTVERGYYCDTYATSVCEEEEECDYKQLKRLEQENKELKEFCVELERQKQKQHHQWFIRCTEINVEASQYRSALEEINITVKQLLKGVTSNCINNTPYLVALSLIENKINEVLQ